MSLPHFAGTACSFNPCASTTVEWCRIRRSGPPGNGLVEALAGETGFAGDLAHSFGSGDVTAGPGNESRIVTRLFETGLKIGRNLLRGA